MKTIHPRREKLHLVAGKAFVAGKVSPSVEPHIGIPAPHQLTPPNGAIFSNYPRTTTLTWSPVANAASYTVELDCFECCADNKWCTAVGKTWQITTGIEGTQYVFNWVGAQPGRWKVWAVGKKGRQGRKSPWSKFTYTV